MDLIAVGEMLIDFLPGQEAGSYVRNAGGAPANVAIAAARNGLAAGICCKVGDDDFGHFLIDTLKENGVTPLTPAPCPDAVTTMAFVTLNAENERSFTFARKPGADMMLTPEEITDEMLAGCRVLHAGSFLLSAGSAAFACESAIYRAHRNGTLVSFDINYRDMVWNGDRRACTARVLDLLSCVDLLKVSEEEVDMLGGADRIPDLMREHEIAAVVLTLGSAGAQVFHGGECTALPAYPADFVADTTGAGDAFWGGFLSRLLILGADKPGKLNMEILKDAVDYGNASGSLAVREKGAITSLPTRAQIEAFRQRS